MHVRNRYSDSTLSLTFQVPSNLGSGQDDITLWPGHAKVVGQRTGRRRRGEEERRRRGGEERRRKEGRKKGGEKERRKEKKRGREEGGKGKTREK